MEAFHQLEPQIGIAATCAVLQINRARIYRERARALPALPRVKPPRPRPPLALSDAEWQELLQSSTANGSRTWVLPASMRRCWMRAVTTAPCAPCIECWHRRSKLVNVVGSAYIRATKSPSCWRLNPMKFGPGTLVRHDGEEVDDVSDRDFSPCWRLTDGCNAIRLGTETGDEGVRSSVPGCDSMLES